jgi:hypothetical protein
MFSLRSLTFLCSRQASARRTLLRPHRAVLHLEFLEARDVPAIIGDGASHVLLALRSPESPIQTLAADNHSVAAGSVRAEQTAAIRQNRARDAVTEADDSAERSTASAPNHARTASTIDSDAFLDARQSEAPLEIFEAEATMDEPSPQLPGQPVGAASNLAVTIPFAAEAVGASIPAISPDRGAMDPAHVPVPSADPGETTGRALVGLSIGAPIDLGLVAVPMLGWRAVAGTPSLGAVAADLLFQQPGTPWLAGLLTPAHAFSVSEPFLAVQPIVEQAEVSTHSVRAVVTSVLDSPWLVSTAVVVAAAAFFRRAARRRQPGIEVLEIMGPNDPAL